MTQSINVKHVLIEVFVPVSLHLHGKFVLIFNRLNFPDCSEQVQFYLGVLDLDLTFEVEKHVDITNMLVALKRKFIMGLGKGQTDLA